MARIGAESDAMATAAMVSSPVASRRRWEAADTVIALSVGLLILIFGIFGFLVWQGYRDTVKNAETRAATAASILAGEVRWIFGTSVATLRQVAAEAARDPANGAATARASFAEMVPLLPMGSSLALYDRSGSVLPGGTSSMLPASIAGLDFFAALVEGEALAVSSQLAAADTGEAAFAIAVPIRSDGVFAGAAVVGVPGALLSELLAPQNLGPDSAASLVRTDGWVIVRHPALSAPMNLASLPVFETLTAGEAGVYQSPSSPADGLARVVAFSRVGNLPLIAIASVSRDAVLAGLWTAVVTVLWLLGPIALALFVGSLLAAHLLRQSERTRRNLATALANNDVLFQEIHHRVKNNLQSVASLLQMQAIPKEVKADMAQRIAAMSAVHEHIYRTKSFHTVFLRDYLATLLQNIRAGYEDKVEVIAKLDDLPVDKDIASSLGLVFNEVVSNVFKHAFPDGRNGVVTITLERDAEATGRLAIEDNGVGFDPDAPARGIGRRLVLALVAQMGGRSTTSSGETGSRFALTFPLAPPGI